MRLPPLAAATEDDESRPESFARAYRSYTGSSVRSRNIPEFRGARRRPRQWGDTGPSAIRAAPRDASAYSGIESSHLFLRNSFGLENTASETTLAQWQLPASYPRRD